MECSWCMMGYKENEGVLQEFCSPQVNTKLSQRMNSNLVGCLDCVIAYHHVKDNFLTKNKFCEKELFTWEVNRLCEHMRTSLRPNNEIKTDEDLDREEDKAVSGDDLLEKLSISLQEVLNYPYLLWSSDLANFTTEALLRLEEEGSPLVLHDKLPGVYLLIIHPYRKVRKWALESVRTFGSISCDDYDDLRNVVKWIINVSEFDLLRSGNLDDIDANLLPSHLFLRNKVKEYWASVYELLKMFESRPIRLQMLSRDNHSQFVTMLLTAMDHKNCQDNGRDSEFWPLLECLLILLKRLESRFWQHANTGSQTDLFVLVVLHPAYLNEMKMLPGYNGGDKDIDAKPSDETSSTSSIGSIRKLMLSWIKHFMESIVPFGDGAKKAVTFVFKYLNCLKDEFETASEGYDNGMMAMVQCLQFLLKNSLKSFLNNAAKCWMPNLMTILKLDSDKPLPCRKQAISFCKMFLQQRRQTYNDVSSLVTWLDQTSERDIRKHSKNLNRIMEYMKQHFRDLPPVTRYFDRTKKKILVPASSRNRHSKAFGTSGRLIPSSPLLDGKVCLTKLDVQNTGVETKREPILISDSSDGSSDDNEPLRQRFSRKRLPVKEKTPLPEEIPIKTDDVDDDDDVIRYNTSFETRKQKIVSDVPEKREMVMSGSPSDEQISISSDEELVTTHVFSPCGKWQDESEKGMQCVETLSTGLSRIKKDEKHVQHVETLVAESPRVELVGEESLAALRSPVETETDEFFEKNTFAATRSRIKREEEGRQHELTFAIARSHMKRKVKDLEDEETYTIAMSRMRNELMDLEDEKTFSTELSQVKHEVGDLEGDEIFAFGESRVKKEVEDLENEGTNATARSHVKCEVENLDGVKTIVIAECQVNVEVNDLQDEETFATVESRVKNEVEDFENERTFADARLRVKQEAEDEEIFAIKGTREKHEVEDLEHEKTLSNARSHVKHGVDDLIGKEKYFSLPCQPAEKDLQYEERQAEIKMNKFQGKEAVSTVKSESNKDLLDERTFATLRPKIRSRLKKLKEKVRLSNVVSRTSGEAGELPHEEKRIAKVRSSGEQANACNEETVTHLKSYMKYSATNLPQQKDEENAAPFSELNNKGEVKNPPIEIAPTTVKLCEENGENDLLGANKSEPFANIKCLGRPNKETLAAEGSRDRPVMGMHQDKTVPKLGVEKVKPVSTREKRKLTDVQPEELVAKKQKNDTGNVAATIRNLPVDNLRTNPNTSRNTDSVNTLVKRKVAQTFQKSSSIKTVNSPDPVKTIPVTRMNPVETKPSKPLTMEELYYVILNWNPNMLMKNCNLEIPHGGRVTLTYSNTDEYYSVFKPLLYMECWAQALREWNNTSRTRFTCDVKNIKFILNKFLLVFCHHRIPSKSNGEERILRESDLIVIHDKYEKSLFAIVEDVKQKRLDPRQNDNTQYIDLNITLRLVPKERPLLVNETIRCEVVTSLVTTLRQWKGMIFFPRSLLARDILQPRVDKCCNNTLNTGKTTVEEDYNKSQATAINGTIAALRLPFPIPRISFIQGPPGTGKSHTIIGLIKAYLKNREIDLNAEKGNCLPGSKITNNQASGKILLCAPSNAAVYVLVRRMIAEMKTWKIKNGAVKGKNCGCINLVCVGRTSTLHPEILPFALDTLLKCQISVRSRNSLEQEQIAQRKVEVIREKIDELEKKGYQLRLAGFRDDSKEVKSNNQDIDKMVRKKQEKEGEHLYLRRERKMMKHEEEKMRKDIILSADVICCTLSGSGSALLHKLLNTASGLVPFGCVIVDEACQSCELDLLIPLQFGSSKLVMVGDPEQLRSTVLSKKAQELFLGQSMYERLYKVFKKRANSSGRPLHTLQDNPIQLLDLQYRMHPSISHFPARYIYQGRVKDDGSLLTRKSISSLKPYALVNVRNGMEQFSSAGSLCNPTECDLVVQICWILKKEINENHFGVITPYRAQVKLTKELLKERGMQSVEVDTVDGFQGREKDVVIMSCVRASGGYKSIGFLADRTRLNVALTRAKHSLVILLNVSSLETNNDWKACIDEAKERGVLYDVNSAKDLLQLFVNQDTLEIEHLQDFTAWKDHKLPSCGNGGQRHNAPTAGVSSSRRTSVSRENACTVRDIPADGGSQNEKASTADILLSSMSIPKFNGASNEKNSGSDEFDFDDFEPDIGCFHSGNGTTGCRLTHKKSPSCDLNENSVSSQLIDRVVQCGQIFQAQQDPYMQQLVRYKRTEKGEELI